LLRTGWYNISREAYFELPRISKELPRCNKIKQEIAELYVAYAIGGVNSKGIAPLKLGYDACAVPIFISVVPAHVKSPSSTIRCI